MTQASCSWKNQFSIQIIKINEFISFNFRFILLCYKSVPLEHEKSQCYPEFSVGGRGPKEVGRAGMAGGCAPVRRGWGGQISEVCEWRLEGHRVPAAWPIPEAAVKGRDAASTCHQTAPACHHAASDPPTNSTSPIRRATAKRRLIGKWCPVSISEG